MLRRKTQCKDYDPEQYLRDADNRFSFDPESGIYKPKPYNKEKKRKKFKILSLSPFQWGTLILSALTLIFLIKYTHYARLQWKEAKRTADQSTISATAAQSAAGTAEKALADSKASAREDRRPWVGLQNFICKDCKETPVPQDPSGLEVEVSGELIGIFVNTGKTPALRMRVGVISTAKPKIAEIPTWDSAQKEIADMRAKFPPLSKEAQELIAPWQKLMARDESAESVLPPNGPMELSLGWPRRRRNFATLPIKAIVIYSVGKITYYDSLSNKPHTTTFCLMNEVRTEFRFCPTGNWMD